MKPTFYYTALNAAGEQETGSVLANSEADAIRYLRDCGMYPTSITTQQPQQKERCTSNIPMPSISTSDVMCFVVGLIGGIVVVTLCLFLRN